MLRGAINTPASRCFLPEPLQELLQPASLSSHLSGINFCAWCLLKALENATEQDMSPQSPPSTALQASHLLPHPAWQGAIFKS